MEMLGLLQWSGGLLIVMLMGLTFLSLKDEAWREKNCPEHEISAFWDDEDADYTYVYRIYGRLVAIGGEAWARDMAKHYGIDFNKIEKEN